MPGLLGSAGLESEGFVLSAGAWDLHVCKHRVSRQQSSVFELLVPVTAAVTAAESATVRRFVD